MRVRRLIVLVLCAATAAGCEATAPTAPTAPTARDTPTTERKDCVRPTGVADISFSATKYPNILQHVDKALGSGWPAVLVLRREGADRRRDRLLDAYDTRPGMDRDEYPPAVGRGRWRAHVAYVPSSENRSHGATLGIKLRRFCDGTRFRYVFY